MVRPIASIILDKMNGIEEPIKSTPKSKTVRQIVTLSEEHKDEKRAMLNSLRVGVWVVEFDKVDGTPAIMECTLDSRLLPQSKTELNPSRPTTGAAAAAEHLIHAYAVDRQGWRSFSVPNVKRFYKKLESL